MSGPRFFYYQLEHTNGGSRRYMPRRNRETSYRFHAKHKKTAVSKGHIPPGSAIESV